MKKIQANLYTVRSLSHSQFQHQERQSLGLKVDDRYEN